MCAAIASSVILSLAVDAAPASRVSTHQTTYEPGAVEVVAGDVIRMETLPRAGGAGRDVTVVLRTAIGDEVRVAVAPQWVTKAMGLRLRAGDHIQVTGWRIIRGKPALLAAEIDSGGQVLVFRDRHGVAVWGPRQRLRAAPDGRIEQP